MGHLVGSNSMTLPGTTSSGPAARHFVEDMVGRWGPPELVWPAALCVSELAANAALHARTPFTVRVSSLSVGTIRLEVEDGSARTPVVRDYGTGATTGRGLHLVAALSHAWGVVPGGAGKTVWLELHAEDEAHRPADAAPLDVDVDALLAAYDDGA